MNRNRKRKAAATLAAGMAVILGAGTVMGAAAQSDTVSKEETVYVNTAADGSVEDITVSNWLKNSGDTSAKISDVSNLTDIKNVKGDETFTQSGKNLTWDTDGKDIYYQGKSTKELPVTMSIKYYLDGSEISPDNLAGKSGHLKIKVSYKNNTRVSTKVDGKSTTMYSPFVMVTGMILPTDNFSDITIDNGKVISDGSRNIVVGMAMPGLKKNLALSKDMEKEVTIPEDFTVEADVTDCEISSSFTVALTDVFDEVDLGDMDSLDELKDSMDDLKDAAVKLVKGTKSL